MRQASRIFIFYQDKILLYQDKMSKVAGCKGKLKTRTITEKYKILKGVDKGESSASISKKYYIAKQTLSGWLKEKAKFYSEAEKSRTSEKSQHAMSFYETGWVSPYEDLDKACYMGLLSSREQTFCAWIYSESESFVFYRRTWVWKFGWVARQMEKRYNVSFKKMSVTF